MKNLNYLIKHIKEIANASDVSYERCRCLRNVDKEVDKKHQIISILDNRKIKSIELRKTKKKNINITITFKKLNA